LYSTNGIVSVLRKNNMDRVCITNRKDKTCREMYLLKPERRENPADLNIAERIILKNQALRFRIWLIWLRSGISGGLL
jgi:hypothetical protein